jgi:hypothetical protein
MLIVPIRVEWNCTYKVLQIIIRDKVQHTFLLKASIFGIEISFLVSSKLSSREMNYITTINYRALRLSHLKKNFNHCKFGILQGDLLWICRHY